MQRTEAGLWFFSLLSVLACTEKKSPNADATSVINGRVFIAGQASPLRNAEVILPDGTTTKTDENGVFTGRTKQGQGGFVKTERDGYAPVSKEAPKGDGYLELYAKAYDAKADVFTDKGGRVVVEDNGAAIEVKEDQLVAKEGKTPKNVSVQVAVPDPRKATDLPSIPGDFDATKEGKVGKVSAESPLYVEVKGADKEQKFEFDRGMKANAKFPARRADQAEKTTLFHYNEEKQEWEARGEAKRNKNKAINPTYDAEIDELGWWTVGEFYDRLTCLHACVEDDAGKRVPYARAVATGVDHFTQVSAYANDEGCFALDVRASAQISLLVQAIDGYVPATIVMTPSTVATVADDFSKCENLGVLTLTARKADSECPLGLRACNERCVDVRSDVDNCGACKNACGGTEGRELSCIDGLCACPFGYAECTGTGEPASQGGGSMSAADPNSGDGSGTGQRDPGAQPVDPADAGTQTAPIDANRPPSGSTRAQTAGYCANRFTDEQNCGGCGIVCAVDQTCTNGACTGAPIETEADAGPNPTPMSCVPTNSGASASCEACLNEQCCQLCTGECPALLACAVSNCQVDIEKCDVRQVCPREATDQAVSGFNAFFNDCVYTTCRSECSGEKDAGTPDAGVAQPNCRQMATPIQDACAQGQDVCLGRSVTYQCDVVGIASLYTYQVSAPNPDAAQCNVSCLVDGKPLAPICSYNKNICGDPTTDTVPCDPSCAFPAYVPRPAFGLPAPTVVVPGNEMVNVLSCGGTKTSEIACNRGGASLGVCCLGTSGDPYCDSVQCTNGGSESFFCDGKEDCGTGMQCCLVVDGATRYSSCTMACGFIDAGAGTAEQMCHTNADCGAGLTCQSTALFPYWGTCR